MVYDTVDGRHLTVDPNNATTIHKPKLTKQIANVLAKLECVFPQLEHYCSISHLTLKSITVLYKHQH